MRQYIIQKMMLKSHGVFNDFYKGKLQVYSDKNFNPDKLIIKQIFECNSN